MGASLGFGLLCFVVGFLVGVYLSYRAHIWNWILCSGCERWMGKDGKPLESKAYIPSRLMQAQQRDLCRFARRAGWKIQLRPAFIAHCPDCVLRQQSFRQVAMKETA